MKLERIDHGEPGETKLESEPENEKQGKRNILSLGMVSCLMDASTEMVYPIIPLYLTSAFGATPALVGIIEGIAESTASLLKVFSGYFTDKYQKKKAVAFTGYATSLLYKIALLLSTSWVGILVSRVIDRLGKGIRTSPRDVMVSESSSKDSKGKSFGIHKALDMAGSAIGILLSFFILKTIGDADVNYKMIFVVSIIPAIMSLFMFKFVKEPERALKVIKREKFWVGMKDLDNNLKLYLVVVTLFTLGNSSNAFLLLKAKSVGFDDTSVILLYFLYNLSASALAIPFGKLSDKCGRKNVLTAGYIMFGLVYIGFAFAEKSTSMYVIFVLYGLFTAMTSGVEKAMISEIAPPDMKGTMLGLHSILTGLALLPASIIFGFIWNTFGNTVPFVFGAVLAFVSAAILGLFLKDRKGRV